MDYPGSRSQQAAAPVRTGRDSINGSEIIKALTPELVETVLWDIAIQQESRRSKLS